MKGSSKISKQLKCNKANGKVDFESTDMLSQTTKSAGVTKVFDLVEIFFSHASPFDRRDFECQCSGLELSHSALFAKDPDLDAARVSTFRSALAKQPRKNNLSAPANGAKRSKRCKKKNALGVEPWSKR